MEQLTSWNEALLRSFENIWTKTIGFIPEIVGALVVLVVGVWIASWLGKLTKRVIEYTKIDKITESLGITKKMKEMGIEFTLASVLGWLVKWFIVVAVLLAVVNVLHLTKVSEFIEKVVLYIPNVIVAVIILAIGMVIGGFIQKVIVKSAQASSLLKQSGNLLGGVANWAIIIFAGMAALIQLGVAPQLIQILFAGVVGMLAIAGGLSLGLGTKDHIKKWLDKVSGSNED